MKDDGTEEYDALAGADPPALDARGDEAGLDHHDDEGSGDRTDDRALAAEDRGAADEHRGEGGEQVALTLGVEEVLVLERQQYRGDAAEQAHHGEQLDLLVL